MDVERDVTALPLGEGTETGSERSGLANPCPGRPEQADDSRIAVSPSPDRSATALPLDVLRDCRDSAALHVARCRGSSDWDLVPYYEGRRDAFAEIIRHIEHPEDMDA